ncbi:MAG: hemolysin III family protein [Myxococcota bacterium]
MPPAPPIFSFAGFCDPVASWTHLAAALAALMFGWRFVKNGKDGVERAGMAVFVVGAIFLFAMSGTYHVLDRGTEARGVMQLLDHAAIWVMIAGTITAVHFVGFDDAWRWGMTALVWVGAIAGMVLKTVYFDVIDMGTGLWLYVGLGWLGMVSFLRLRRLHGTEATRPVLLGGVVYTAGAVVEFLEAPWLARGVIGPHEIFHAAVVGGAALHAWGILKLARRRPDAAAAPVASALPAT